MILYFSVMDVVWRRLWTENSCVSAAGGVIASVVVALSVLWVGAVDGVGFHETTAFFNLSGLPVSIGLYGFCYSGHAVFPNIYSSLRNRNDYNKLLAVRYASYKIARLKYQLMLIY